MTLDGFLASEAGLALKGALIAAFADLATGVFASLKDNTFSMDALAAFLRKHILGRVCPLGVLLALGYYGGPAGEMFLPFAIAGLAAYAAETIASVKGNFSPPKESDVKDDTAAARVNPVPSE